MSQDPTQRPADAEHSGQGADPAEPVSAPRRTRRRIDPEGDTLASQQVPLPPKPPIDEILPPDTTLSQPAQPVNHPDPAVAPVVPHASTLITAPLEDSFEDEAAARARARDRAVVGSGPLSVVLQIVLALLAPVVILIAVIRLVASPVFLWLEYHRPGFPADAYGMDTEQRLTLGSYGVDYLMNFAPPAYLADLRFSNGNPAFTEAEVGHMADVKQVIMATMLGGTLAAIVCVVIMVLLYRMRKGAIARSLFAGSIWFTAAMIALAVVAALSWEAFFAWFHGVFFADGTWTFYTTDTLIRLYPGQFWIDAGIAIAALTLITMIVLLIVTAPTGRRRFRNAQAQRLLEAQVTGEQGASGVRGARRTPRKSA